MVLGLASFWLGIVARLGLGPQVLTLGIAAVRLYVEAAPHRATKIFQPPARGG